MVAVVGTVTRVREGQLAKAAKPMVVRPAGKEMEVREEQAEKASSPIAVRPAGRVRVVREEQPRKAQIYYTTIHYTTLY